MHFQRLRMMLHLRFRSPRLRTFGLLAALAVSAAPVIAGQPPKSPPAETQPPDTEAEAKQTPAGRQPGDDVTEELKDPINETDPKKIESRAAFMEGLAAQKRGDLNDALKAFQRASAADPTAVEPVRAHAVLLRRLGKIPQAEAVARKAIGLDKDDYQMRLELAGLLLSRNKADEAAALIDDALNSRRLDKQSAEFINLHSVRGRIFLLAQNTAKAAESYDVILKALEKPEDYGLDFRQHQTLMNDGATGYDTVGKVMLEVGRNKQAVTAFSALARVNNDTPGNYHYWLALSQYRIDDLPAAEKNLDRYFESHRRSRESLQLLSDIYRADARSDKIPEKLRALTADTNDADAVNMFLGELLVDKGEGAEAAKVYQSVIANSGNADAYVGLIRVDILNRDAKSLMQSVKKALRARIQREELEPLTAFIVNNRDFGEDVVQTAVTAAKDSSAEHDPTATYFYSQVADALELPEQEATLLQATLQQNPNPGLGIQAMNKLGINQLLHEKYAEAATAFKNLLAIPGLPQGERVMSLYRLSFAEAELENYDVAITAVETALQLQPDNPQLTQQLGTIQLQARQFDNAEKTLQTAIELSETISQLNSVESQARVLLGSLYSQTGRWDDAIQAYQKLLQMPELEANVIRRGRMLLSNAYVQKGDMAGGEKILEEVYAQDPTEVGINNDLGYLYAEQNKKLEQAEKMVRLAVAAEPENAAYLDSLGWVLYRLQKYDEAEAALIKANSDPDYRDSTIIEHLGDVQHALKKTEAAEKTWQEALEVEQASASPNEAVINRLTKKLQPEAAEKPEKPQPPETPETESPQ